MSKKIKKATFVFLLCCSVLLFSIKKEKLDSINKQIKDITNKINQLKKEKRSILNDIYEIELRYEKERIENNKIKFQLRRTQEKIDKQESKKKELKVEIQNSKENVKRTLRTLYKIPGNLYILLFIKVDSSDQLYKNYGLFKSLVIFQSKEINKIKQNIHKLEEVKKDLQNEHTNLFGLTKLKEQKLRNIKSLKQKKLTFIKKINNDRKNHIKLLDELKYEAARLTEIIYNKRIKRSFLTLNLKRLKGNLMWPIDGKVISSYGRKKSLKFNTYIFNNGIEIKPSYSDKIKVIYNGEIVFADYFKGYGNLIIVQHSKDFLTLYGHCEKFLKKKGDRVNRGEFIALAGSSGSISGKSLYFEVRKKLKAQNPLKWLRKR